ncbi:MAG: DUF58 domain-containing protein [Steroidobacter sp.]
MRLHVLPGRNLLTALGAALLIALLLCALNQLMIARWFTVFSLLSLIIATSLDINATRKTWRDAALQFSRRLPAAFALGVKRHIPVYIAIGGEHALHLRLVDHSDASLHTMHMPVDVVLQPGSQTELGYIVTPTRRGEVIFAKAQIRFKSLWKLLELQCRVGIDESRRVYPDFAQVAKYAWLAGDRRLSEIGIKTFRQRGEGTYFKQLAEYRVGDSLRHIDWKATQRFDKPIIREFQNERDQCVLMLIDCGRRMRADERIGTVEDSIGSSHFDQVLNAAMLLGYVALKQGDAVGALTFGTPAGQQRWFAPRKGISILNALMGELYAVQPTPTHSDYVTAAKDLLRRQTKRAMVIVITNFRDEDAGELGQAIRLLQTRHLVLTASLRERVVRELASQPMNSGDALIEIASAHLYEQSRRDAFNQLAAHNALMVDAEPERLGVELVNRYEAAKRAGMI